jgi:hypothetical protein
MDTDNISYGVLFGYYIFPLGLIHKIYNNIILVYRGDGLDLCFECILLESWLKTE